MSKSNAVSILISSLLVACAAGSPMEDAGPPPTDSGTTMTDGEVPMTDSGMPGRDGSTCSGMDACTLGAQRCSGVQIETCEVDPGTDCTVWSAAADCADAGFFCSGDVCTDTCSDACTDGARTCSSSDGFQLCELQTSGCLDWSPEAMCPTDEVCSGAGACMACTDGASRCGPLGEVQECISGRWTLIEGCPFGCSAGVCDVTVACTTGAYRCRGNNVEVCNSSGSAWLHTATCAVSCGGGLCTGACDPGATRCNGAGVETCNAGGTAWAATETCTTFCAVGGCALDGLEVAAATTLDGDIYVEGAVVVRSGATVTSPTGDLTIHADSITIENGASISVAPSGESSAGDGRDGRYVSPYYRGGGGGSYGSRGSGYFSLLGSVWGSANDADVQPGAAGGDGLMSPSTVGAGSGAFGGGVVRLIADNITIAGQVTANGGNGSTPGFTGGGGGSGGGILLAGDSIIISGAVSAVGGNGAVVIGTGRSGGDGGNGRVKILYGGTIDETGATVTGTVTRGVLPPIELASGTHPNPDVFYNDGFEVVGMSWGRPFDPLTGYYWLHHTSERVPTPANADFVAGEIISFPVDELANGTNLFQVVSVNPTALVGTVEGAFRIQLNRTPPPVSSTSHPSSSTWTMNPNIFLSWTMPQGEENYQGIYYVFDDYGDTVPTTSDTFVSIDQLQVLLSGIADGIWVFHVASVDSQGYLTRSGGHYQVRIGEDPGEGTVFGQVTDATTSMAISGATVSVNRGIVGDQGTNSTGNYNFPAVTNGSWELRVQADGYMTDTQMVTVLDGMSTAANVSLTPLP